MTYSLIETIMAAAEEHSLEEHGLKTASYCPDCLTEHMENRHGETCEKCGSTIAGYGEWGVQTQWDQSEAAFLKKEIDKLYEVIKHLQGQLLQRML